MPSLIQRCALAAASALTLAAVSTATLAADILPPPPPPDLRPAVSDWSGLYIGGFGGVGCLEAHYVPPPPAVDPNMGGCAGMAGVFGGYNHQLGNWVLGIEGDYGWAFDGHLSYAPPPEATNYFIDDLATVRGRLGWLANDSTMIYVTGGYGWLGTTFDGLVGPAADFVSTSRTLGGWVAGGGLETALTDNLYMRAEYLYGRFEDASYDISTGACAPACIVDMEVDDYHSFRVGLSYKFSWGGGYDGGPVYKN